MSQLYERGSLWFIPTQGGDAFPKADHTSTTVLADSVFANTGQGVKFDGWMSLDTAVAGTLTFKDTAGGALFVKTTAVTTSGASQPNNILPNGMDMGSGFSVNFSGASANIVIWYRLPPN